MKKVLNGIDRLTNHPIYQLVVSLSLIGVSFYDMAHVILSDFIHLKFRKEHLIILVGLLMFINSINTLFKGVKGIEKAVVEEEEQATTSAK